MNLQSVRQRMAQLRGDPRWFAAAWKAFEALVDMERSTIEFNKYCQHDSPEIFEKCRLHPIRTPEQFRQVLLVLDVILNGRKGCGGRDDYYGVDDPTHPHGFNEAWMIQCQLDQGDAPGSILGAALGYPGLNEMIGSSLLMRLLWDYADDRVKWNDIIRPLLAAVEKVRS